MTHVHPTPYRREGWLQVCEAVETTVRGPCPGCSDFRARDAVASRLFQALVETGLCGCVSVAGTWLRGSRQGPINHTIKQTINHAFVRSSILVVILV